MTDKSKPWLVTMTDPEQRSDTYGPLEQAGAIELRDVVTAVTR